jgi:hypothetical protein
MEEIPMMQFGNLKCKPIPVNQVIDGRDFDGQHAAIHGILFYGEGCETDEFLLLPKDGTFDGVGPIPMPTKLDRSRCLLIEERNLDAKLGGSSVAGLYRFKNDAIVIGEIRRQPLSSHPVRIGDLWLILMQDWLDMGFGAGSAHHELRVISFPQRRLPVLPWNGMKANGSCVIQIQPSQE